MTLIPLNVIISLNMRYVKLKHLPYPLRGQLISCKFSRASKVYLGLRRINKAHNKMAPSPVAAVLPAINLHFPHAPNRTITALFYFIKWTATLMLRNAYKGDERIASGR